MWRSLVSRLVRVQEAVGSNPATPTKILRFLCRKHKNLRISSFANPIYLCDTPKPGNAEKADYSTDYLAEMLTRRKRRQDRQRGRCFAGSGLPGPPFFHTLTCASPRNASLCLGVTIFDLQTQDFVVPLGYGPINEIKLKPFSFPTVNMYSNR